MNSDLVIDGSFGIGSGLVPATTDTVPSRSMLRQYLLRSLRPSLAGKVYDESPGLGTDRDRLPGRCVSPDAVNDYADLASAIQLTGEFTIVWWAKRTSTAQYDFVLGAAAGTQKIGYLSATHNVAFRLLNGGDVDIAVAMPVPSTEWHQVAFRRLSDNTIDLLVNGGFVSKLFGGAPQPGTLLLDRVLNDNAGVHNGMGGQVSDIRIYDRSISDAEIEQIHQVPETTLGAAAGLVAHYKCDSQDSTQLLDSSGNENHATLSGHNATVGNFFYEGAEVPVDYLNSCGYTDGGSGVAIPRDESNKAFDVFGQPLQYRGKAPKPGQLIESNCGTFGGTTEHVSVAGSEDFISPDMSFGGFFNLEDSAVGFISKGNSTQWLVYVDTIDRIVVRVGGTAGDLKYDYGADGHPTGRQHIIATFTGTTVKLFLAGQLVATKSDMNAMPAATSDLLTIGSISPGFYPYVGPAFDVRVYKRTLSDSEVLALANGQDVDSTGLVGSYPFSEGSGTKIHNVVPGGPHGNASGINESTFWGAGQDVFHYNAVRGYTRYVHSTLEDILVPFRVDGTPMPYTPPTGYTLATEHQPGALHNLAESQLDFKAGVDYPTRGEVNPPRDYHPAPKNLITNTSDYADAYWTKYRANITSNALSGMDRVIATSAFGSHAISRTESGTIAGRQYLVSIRAKADAADYLMIHPGVPPGGQYFDLANGLVLGPYTTGGVDDAFIEHLGDGEYECSVVITATGTATRCEAFLSETGTGIVFSGDNVGGLYLSDAKIQRYFPENPLFVRQRTQNSQLIGGDRFVQYDQVLSGTRLAQVQKFTQAEEV